MVEETRVPGENHRLSQVTDKLDHIIFNIKLFIANDELV
jgi:hypothetical protein